VSLIKREMGTSSERIFFGQSYQPETISSLILKDLAQRQRRETCHDATALRLDGKATKAARFELLIAQAIARAVSNS
jgi:hypothetical protein